MHWTVWLPAMRMKRVIQQDDTAVREERSPSAGCRLAHVREMMANLSSLENRFTTNLNNDNTTLEFTPYDLSGVPANILAGFKQTTMERISSLQNTRII